MQITEEQRKRIEANRLAAIAKRNASIEMQTSEQREERDPWRLFTCRKITSVNTKKPQDSAMEPASVSPLPEMFRVRLEICSPDSFMATPIAMRGFTYPGEEECLRKLSDLLLDVIPLHYTQNHNGGKACVYKLRDYSAILACLKKSKGIEVEEVPWVTYNVVEKLSHSIDSGRWEPSRPEHFTDEKVDKLMGKLPKSLLDVLLPFQLDGVRFALRRGGQCLIADEMGLGKTLQAIAIAGCFMDEGSILVVCPAVLRFSWAEELERWLPGCLPSHIHLVFGHQNNPDYLASRPKIVVISYTMLNHLRKSIHEREWALLIVDESHHLRCSRKKSDPEEVRTVLDVAANVKRIVLLSGTPSLSRPYDIFHQINMLWPGLLGKDKYEFAKTYCDVNYVSGPQGKLFQDFSRGVRLEELNVLLKQTVMIRRLKEHVLTQLPPKRRQIISLVLKKSDIAAAKSIVNEVNYIAFEEIATADRNLGDSNKPDAGGGSPKSEKLSNEELGVAKLVGFREWLSIHPLMADPDAATKLDLNISSCKMIIFAHHHRVLDGIQEFLCEKGISFVRIDGKTLAKDRQLAVQSFRSSNEVKIAIIGITAGGVGLDFSSAQNVVFLELPQTPSIMLQAEDRAHRRGQMNAVNIYIFCAKDTTDESHWKNLNRRLHRVSSTTNGKYDAVREIAVEGVSYLEPSKESCHNQVLQKTESGWHSAELMKLHSCGLEQDLQLSEVVHEEAPEMNDRYEERSESDDNSAQADVLHSKAEIVLELEVAKLHPSIDIMANFYDSEVRSLGPDSPHEPNEQSEEDYQIGKVQGHVIDTQAIKIDGNPVQHIEADCCSSKVDWLRFEVSQYTGRIHLYSCISGRDSRPQPLFENFRPEDLESENLPPAINKKDAFSGSIKDNPAYRPALLEFVTEWNKLRPVEQKKLFGKPLQLPLSVELCYLSENISHNKVGLLKGGSKRRTTPLYEISLPLPSDAVWKKVHIRSGHKKMEKEYTQGWTLKDEPLCKLCQKTSTGRSAKQPEYFEDLFCNLGCFEEYRIRTSNGFLRQQLFQIEHGICTNCQLDCHQLVKRLKPLSLEKRLKYIEKVAPRLVSRKTLLKKLVNDPTEGNAWHADHIIPVYRGGGECMLENLRTLCVACHSDVTMAQHAERQATRIKARKRLKVMLNNSNNSANIEESITQMQDKECSEMLEKFDEEELLVEVPGSAYAVAHNLDVSSKTEER